MASTEPVVEPTAESSVTAQPATQAPEAPEEDKNVLNLQTLKDHSSHESFYMLLHGKVYDVTKFLDEHPGGDEVMLEEGGKDATEPFEDVGHSDEARAMLAKMYIGEFTGPTSSKAAKKAAAAAAGGSTSTGGGFPIWVIPAALFVAYLAWRLLLA